MTSHISLQNKHLYDSLLLSLMSFRMMYSVGRPLLVIVQSKWLTEVWIFISSSALYVTPKTQVTQEPIVWRENTDM